jgi:hypothetical protein
MPDSGKPSFLNRQVQMGERIRRNRRLEKISPIHRWYFINEMLPIRLARKILKKADGPVLDPFVGVGTVLVEAKHVGLDATGVDINPFMCFVSRVKIGRYDLGAIQNSLAEIAIDKEVKSVPPPIPKIAIYYSPLVLRKLLMLKAGISRLNSGWAKDALTLCFVDVAIRSANIRKSPAPRFAHRKNDYPVFEEFMKNVRNIVNDIKAFRQHSSSTDVIMGDARTLSFPNEEFKLVLTSPPYCNNLDFVRHTQLELYWMERVMNSDDLGRIRRGCITSCEAMAYIGKEQDCSLLEVQEIAEAIRNRTSRRLPEVVTQYFSGMEKHFENLRSVLKPNSKCIYVIGDSKMKGVYIPTHKLLAKIAKRVGFKKVKVSYFRKRWRQGYALGEYILEMQIHR